MAVSNTNNSNVFPSVDSQMNRAPASPATSQANGNGVNYTNGNHNSLQPFPVGHQQDLNFLYQQLQELSGILQSNRERVNEVTRNAEEVAQRAGGQNGIDGSAHSDLTAAQTRIRDLERELVKANKTIELYKHEQSENTALIGLYEEGIWRATDQIRSYTDNTDERFLTQKRFYNDLLQQEKDDHLQTRLDRDEWHAKTLRVCEMIRTAHRLRSEEWNNEYRVIAGLQSEVRCYRRCLGMDPEKIEEETGWPYLKDAPLNDQV